MASVKRSDELRKDLPNKLFLCVFVCVFKVLNHHAKVSTPAILHIQVQILGCLQMFSVIVCHDIWVSEGTQNVKFRGELLSLFLRHFYVVDFFATEYLSSMLVRLLRIFYTGPRVWSAYEAV
jgi:hypothetical protein